MSASITHPNAVTAVVVGKRRFDLDFDIICATYADAKAHARDLKRNYGVEDARPMQFTDEATAYEWLEKNK